MKLVQFFYLFDYVIIYLLQKYNILHPVLSFISPSNRGVKTFVPYSNLYTDDQSRNVRESMSWAMEYVEMTYGSEMNNSIETVQKAVDTSGKDIVRACFLSHDPQALFREY